MDNLTVSILTPMYNESVHLASTAESVMNQSYGNWEWIIVDDDSSDDSVNIARRFADQDSRIKVVSGKGKLGKVEAFNTAFRQASGDYFVLLGGDDVLPPESLGMRVECIKRSSSSLVAAYAKLRTMSDDARQDGILIPRGKKGNRSGGTIILSRALADSVFPIPSDLVAEDIWISEMVRLRAEEVLESDHVVLNYRIHPGNSNPRNQSFDVMTEAIHRRTVPYKRILETVSDLPESSRRSLASKVNLEDARYSGDLVGLFKAPGVSLVQKLRSASMATPTLFALRNRFFRLLSGWM